jgi:V-type H+-transporting ATPase subunit F
MSKSTGKTKFKGKEQTYIAIIADEDTITGFLLAGIGDADAQKGENFLVVTNKVSQQRIEEAFKKFTTRPDISILLISQQVATIIRPVIGMLLSSYLSFCILCTS